MLGAIAFFLEMKYWKDLTVSGYMWLVIKPVLFYVTSLFLLTRGNTVTAELYWNAYLWSLYWFSCMSCVQNTRRLRRFFRYGNFKLSDLAVFTLMDYLFVSIVLMLLLAPISLYFDLGFVDFKIYLLLLLVFVIQIVFLIYIGMLSVNALDISYVFMFTPMLLLILLTNDTYSESILSVIPYFYFLTSLDSGGVYLFSAIVVSIVVGAVLYLYLRNNYKQIYRNSIA